MDIARPQILIATACEKEYNQIAELLALYNYQAHHAGSSDQAFELAKEIHFDAVLISLDMPHGGFELSLVLREIKDYDDVPVTFTTEGESDYALLMEAHFYGGLFLHKRPFDEVELLSQVSAMVRLKTVQDKLREHIEDLDRLASTDPLTGLFNRRMFYQRFDQEMSRAVRSKLAFCMLYIDIDHFKMINDTYGHLAGDEILRRLSEIMVNVLRGSDIISRFGGEEFLVVLPETNRDTGELIAERLRAAIEESPVAYEDLIIPVTISIGTLAVPVPGIHTTDVLINAADGALYKAKDSGRNCVVTRTAAGILVDNKK